MAYLPPEVIPFRFGGMRTDQDSKGAPMGTCELLENTQSTRATEGGIQIEKRPGSPSLSRNIQGGGSLSAGAKVAAFGKELVATDGNLAYVWAPALGTWIKKGVVVDVAATCTNISGNNDTGEALSRVLIDVDVAYANGYACYVCSRDPARLSDPSPLPGEWYVRDTATGAIVGNGSIRAGTDVANARVVAIGTDFFVFYWDGVNTIGCRKIATSDPTQFATAHTAVATNVNTNGRYDVIADVTNSKALLAYRNTTPTLTLMYWLPGMTAGTTQAYATRDPDKCIGILDHTFANGNAYVAIGTSATGVRVLTAPTSTLVVGTDTQVDAAATDALTCTGYFSTQRNVFYTRPGTGTATKDDYISGWMEGTGFIANRSVSLQSRPFTLDGNKRYVLAGHWEINTTLTTQRNLFLLQLDKDATTRNGVRVAGFLADGEWGVWANRQRGLGSCAVVSATLAYVAASGVVGPTLGDPPTEAIAVRSYELDFTGTKTGAPVAFNGGLFFPGAAGKVYDGRTVAEAAFYMRPPKPSLSASAGGSHTAGTVQVVALYSQLDNSGRLIRSGVSDVASIVLTANQQITITVGTLRVTDRSPLHAIDTTRVTPQVKIEVYSTKPGSSTFNLLAAGFQFLTNDASVDTLSTLEVGDNDLSGEELYTDLGIVENATPPMPNVMAVHRNRLFAISGDGSVWHTQETTEGDAAAFAIELRVLFDTADGPLVGLTSDGTTLYALKRSRVYAVLGEGPLRDGSQPYAYPQPLPADDGLAATRAIAGTPDGMLVQTAKGIHLLDRAGGLQNMPGVDAYDTLNVTGGVVLDDRTLAILVTSDGRALCWDWLLKAWHTWTGMPAVSCCRWQNKLVWMESNGKVHVETPGAFSDDGGAYTWTVKLSWLDLINAYTRGLQLVGAAQASCTLQALVSYDFDASNADPTRSLALTTGGPIAPWVLEPNQGYMGSLQLTLTETSTTAGVKLTKALLEVSRRAGANKYGGSRYFT